MNNFFSFFPFQKIIKVKFNKTIELFAISQILKPQFVNTYNFFNSSISQTIQAKMFLTLLLVKKKFEKMLANAF